WLVQNADLLPRRGKALDVACGSGRHALLLSAAGLSVRAVDRDPEAIAELKAAARRLGFRVETEVKDLEPGSADLGDDLDDIALAKACASLMPLEPPPGPLPFPTCGDSAGRCRPRAASNVGRARRWPCSPRSSGG